MIMERNLERVSRLSLSQRKHVSQPRIITQLQVNMMWIELTLRLNTKQKLLLSAKNLEETISHQIKKELMSKPMIMERNSERESKLSLLLKKATSQDLITLLLQASMMQIEVTL